MQILIFPAVFTKHFSLDIIINRVEFDSPDRQPSARTSSPKCSAAYLLARFVGLEAVWFCYPIAECVSVVCCIILASHVFKKDIAQLSESAPPKPVS